jgi:hypothetical protein
MKRLVKSIRIQLSQAENIFKPASPDEVVERKDQYKGKRIEELKNEGTLRPDGKYDFFGLVDLSDEDLTELPQNFFGNIDGSFYLDGNNLNSFVGCPERVRGDFIVDGNNVKSLKGCPKEVGGDFFSDFSVAEVEAVCKVGGEIICITESTSYSGEADRGGYRH